ncbi:MAG: sugar nucleotide-binding protein [Acidobacteria bacterium]|nr:sugar nucleotide-binding protein [Acidobacteriota bacterium]
MLLITGGSGFVGQSLAEFFSPRWPVATTYLTRPASPDSAAQSFQLDIRDPAAVFSTFERAGPKAVIHAAGNKNIRFCEDHPDEAHRINALGTRNVARACRDFGAAMIYVSTDLVFSGVRGNYREDETPRPTLAYGESKLQGERFAREELEDVVVCRSGGVYGKGSPLLRWLAAEIEAGRSIVEFFQSYARAFGLDESLLSPASVGGLKESALLRPDSSLSVEQTSKKLGIPFNSVAEGFARMKSRGGV